MPTVLISMESAQAALVELTRDTAVPVDASILRSDHFASFGHILVGAVAVPGYKKSGRWRVDERDIHRAGLALASLVVDTKDMVAIRIPWRDFLARREDGQPDVRYHDDWRRTVCRSLCDQAMRDRSRADFRNLFDRGEDPQVVRAVSKHLALRFHSERQETQDPDRRPSRRRPDRPVQCGGIPVEPVARIRGVWKMPRALVELFDGAQAEEQRLLALAQQCATCGTDGGPSAIWRWRKATSTGWVTMCPPCTVAAFAVYGGRLRGVQYVSAQRKAVRADEYLCSLCRRARATAWDHCHDHGFVRGPLCASCNGSEWIHFLNDERSPWLERARGLGHLLECKGCRTERTLPQRYRLELVRRQLAAAPCEGACARRPGVEPGIAKDGVARFQMRCWHRGRAVVWETAVALSDWDHLVRALVDQTLQGSPASGAVGASGPEADKFGT